MKTSDAPLIILPAFSCLMALGCTTVEDVVVEGEDMTFRASPTDACREERQIARKTGVPGCPAILSWSASKLFTAAAGELDDYCRYDWNGQNAPTPADIAAIGLHPAIVAHEADCEIVHEQGSDALTEAYAPLLQEMFRASINAPSASDLNLPMSEHARRGVTLAIVDTTPAGAPSPRSIHGASMVAIASDIACPLPNSQCAVETREVLGMPRYVLGGPRDAANGGHFGSLGDLAVGIHEAVRSWEIANDAKPEPSKLVVNLSLGWDPASFTSGPAEDAVLAAIEAVYCKGGIVIAAAGNASEMCTTGALLPGAWEAAPVPDQIRCNQLLPGSLPPSSAGYRPLVFTVGGVDHSGATSAVARDGGVPRLNATADFVRAGSSTIALTGTSTSTAAISGAAALLWSYNPNLQPGEVMDAVYGAGVLTGGMADFSGAGVGDTRRRKLDTCAALEAACSTHGCVGMPMLCLGGSSSTTTTADLVSAAEAITPSGVTTIAFNAPQMCTDRCGVDHFGHPSSASGMHVQPCPPVHDPVDMFVHPQPSQPSCPNCTIKRGSGGTAKLIATLDSDWSEHTLVDMYVTVFDGSAYYSYPLGAPPLDSSTWREIRLTERLPATISSATVTMAFSSGDRSTSRLILG